MENELTFKELFYEALKRWRSIIVCSVVFAAVFGAVSYMSDISARDAATEAQKGFEKRIINLNTDIASYDDSISKITDNIAQIDKQIRNEKKELKILGYKKDLAIINNEPFDVSLFILYENKIQKLEDDKIELNKLLAENKKQLETYTESLKTTQTSLAEQKKQLSSLGSFDIIKGVVIKIVFGVMLAIILIGAIAIIKYISHDKIDDAQMAEKLFGLMALGNVSVTKNKKKRFGCKFDEWISIKQAKSPNIICDNDGLRYVCANIFNIISKKQKDIKIVFTGISDKQKRADFVKNLESEYLKYNKNEGIIFANSDNIFSSADAVDDISSCGIVIIAEERGAISEENLQSEIKRIKMLQSDIGGIVLFESK